jgi:hypothetical protein
MGQIRFSVLGTQRAELTSTGTFELQNGTDVQVDAANAYILGFKPVNGSWQIIRSGNDLLFQRRESGVWVTKQTISA